MDSLDQYWKLALGIVVTGFVGWLVKRGPTGLWHSLKEIRDANQRIGEVNRLLLVCETERTALERAVTTLATLGRKVQEAHETGRIAAPES